jgi:hypothetical protein
VKRRMLTSLFLVFTNLAIAAPMTSDIQLNPVLVGPGQTNSISLSQLVRNVPYDVTCMIRSNGAAEQEFDAVKTNFNIYSINGQSTFGVIKLPAKGRVVADGVDLLVPSVDADMSALEFTNLDDTDYVSVSGCVAKVHFDS